MPTCILAIITPPGLQRKNRGESCTFQWTVQGSFTNYSVYNKSTGALTPLSASATHTRDVTQGLISLTIRNVQLWDAGNYSLSINVGTSTTTDNGALLFVYGKILLLRRLKYLRYCIFGTTNFIK